MMQPKYLQLTDKWQVLDYWVSAKPRLTGCELAVLLDYWLTKTQNQADVILLHKDCKIKPIIANAAFEMQ